MKVLFQFYVSGNELDFIAEKIGLAPDKCSRIVADARVKFTRLFESRIPVVDDESHGARLTSYG